MKPVVLSLEDDEFFMKALELVLSRLGLEIRTTSDITEFLSLSKSLKPALYLVDLQLGTADGVSVIPELRRTHSDAVILVLSGDSKPERVAQAIEAGANDYILKPIDRNLLASKLSQYLITTALKEHSTDVVKLEDHQIQVKLEFDLQVVSIDEMGISVQSPHLIPKKSVLRLKSDLFKTINTGVDDILVTVVSSYMDFETGHYRLYAEFDETKMEFMEAVRRWILLNAKSSP